MEGIGDRSPGARLLRPRFLHPTAGGVPLNLERSIPELFAEQAALRPEKTAIAGTDWQPSYAELDAASNRLAHELAERSGGAAGQVAILLRHDAPLIAAILAALKAGGTAVVLNPSYPAARLAQIRREVEPQFVLTDATYQRLALLSGFPSSSVVAVENHPAGGSEPAPGVAVGPDDLSFLVYTSGSTGRPNGVMQTHRNVVHNARRRLAGGLDLRNDDRIVLLASPSGGQGLSTVWSALLTGATLCPFPVMERGLAGLSAWLAEHGVTVFVGSASLFRHYVRTLDGSRLDAIRLVRLGSDPVFGADFDAFRRHFPESSRFANTYSSSETGNITQQLLSAREELSDEGVAVGSAAEGMEVLLLDDGEIAVRSDYLSPGYWRDEALTRERFVDGLFRTGDLGRMSEDGVLTWVGRKDSQVKVRGTRVDLLEVESALLGRPAVAAAAVRTRRNAGGDTALTAYVTLHGDADPDASGLREALRQTLPDQAVPTSFAFLDMVPMNPHGKVDNEALERIEPETTERTARAVTETQELLADIWADALERDSVGPEDDFFDLEGDSLTAAEVAAEVHASFGVELELGAFAENQTVAEMAELVERLGAGQDGERSPLARVSRDQPLRCSLIQERTWRQSQTPEGSAGYTLPNHWRIRGSLDVERLRRSIDHVVARHESLRTTFAEHRGEPVQVVHPPAPVEVPLIEVESEAAADELLLREAEVPLDLEHGPLARFVLLRLAEDDHRLLRIAHHINCDARSWHIFLEELTAFYEADQRGEEPALEREPLQYADFAAWERETLRPGAQGWGDDVAWWRAHLEGAPSRAPLPFAREAPDERAAIEDGVSWLRVPEAVSAGLERLRRELGATFFMVRLAAYAAQLAVQGDSSDMVIGSYTTTRRLAETRDTFGFFANPVALRLRFEGNPSFGDWLTVVRAAVIEMSAHAQIPYEALCDELRAAGTTPPEFQSIFTTNHAQAVRFAGLEMTPLYRVYGSMPWGFSLQQRIHPEGELCLAAFDARLHDPRAAHAFHRNYVRLLARISDEPDRPVRELVPRAPGRLRLLLERRRGSVRPATPGPGS